MKKLLSLVILFCCIAGSPKGPIFDYVINDGDGAALDFGRLRGRKILLVNIATESDYKIQLRDLQLLQQRYRDSLVVIGLPSNSFGHEPRSNFEIKQYCQDSCNAHFILAEKNSVRGNNKQAIFYWLTQRSENGVSDNEIIGDFQKFLISGDGDLLGVFSPCVSPLSNEITDLIDPNHR